MSRGGQAAAHSAATAESKRDDEPAATGKGGTPQRAALDFLVGRRKLSSAVLVGLHQSAAAGGGVEGPGHSAGSEDRPGSHGGGAGTQS